MRAYKCDACGELFLLPSTLDEDPFESTSVIPMNIWIVRPAGQQDAHLDICKECSEKIQVYMKGLRHE